MTEREQKYLADCMGMLPVLFSLPFEPMAKAVCINALSKHIREIQGMWAPPEISRSGDKTTLIGLTFADLMQLQNGGTIEISPENLGAAFGLMIFLGGTHEHMAEGLKKHPDTDAKFFDSHGEQKN